MGELKQKTAKGTLWVLLEQCCVQGFNFGLGIVLARLLSMSDFGTVAVLDIFITVAYTLVNSGFGQALVQKKDADDLDFTSVFYVSFGLSLILYAVLFLMAPFVARYYCVPELAAILRVLSLNIIFFSINAVQNAELSREMRFDRLFRISLTVTLISGAVGVTLAFLGFGAWALVGSSVTSGAAGVLVRWFFIRWHPKWEFDFGRVRGLLRYGWKMLVSSLLSTFIMKLHGLVIGRLYSRADLAMMNRGQNIPNLLKDSIQISLIEASLPAVSKLQDDPWRQREALRKILIVSTFILFPLMTFLALDFPKIILFLYGAKWLPCVPYARLTCVGATFGLVAAVNSVAFMATGRSDLFLKIGLFGNAISLALILFVLPHGILLWLMVNTFVHAPLRTVFMIWVNRRLLDFGFRIQFCDIVSCAGLTLVTGGCLALSNLIPVAASPVALFICLVCQAVAFATLYFGLAFFFRVRALREVVLIVLPKLASRIPALARLFSHFNIADIVTGQRAGLQKGIRNDDQAV